MYSNEIIIAFNLIEHETGRLLSGDSPMILRIPDNAAEDLAEYLRGCKRLKEYVVRTARTIADKLHFKVVGNSREFRILAGELVAGVSLPEKPETVTVEETPSNTDIVGDWLNRELENFGYRWIDRSRVDWDRFRDYAVNALMSSGQTVHQIRRDLYLWVKKNYGEHTAREAIALI